MIMGMLDGIRSVLPNKYNIVLTDLPTVVDKNDVMVISESDRKALNYIDMDIGQRETLSSISFYVRQSPHSGVYNEVIDDLETYHSLIFGFMGGQLAGKTVRTVSDGDIIPIGRDERGNFLFSLNFTIQYY